jgi:hypothetical protein
MVGMVLATDMQKHLTLGNHIFPLFALLFLSGNIVDDAVVV